MFLYLLSMRQTEPFLEQTKGSIWHYENVIEPSVSAATDLYVTAPLFYSYRNSVNLPAG